MTEDKDGNLWICTEGGGVNVYDRKNNTCLLYTSEVAQENLPTGYTYELGGMAREEAQSSGSATGLIFVLCFV